MSPQRVVATSPELIDRVVCEAPHEVSNRDQRSLEKANGQQSDLVLTDDRPSEYDQRSKAQIFVIMSALFLSLFLAALDFTIVSPALPTISNYFRSAAGYTWVGSSYLLANAASSPVWGKLSDIWGRKPVLLAVVFIFFIGSLVCAASKSIGMLIAGRAVQGSAAGGIVILVNICVSDLFNIRERGFYLGLTGVVWAFASGVGPVLGGAFTQKLSWRWNWWINLPCSGLAFIVLLLFLHVEKTEVRFTAGLKAIDWMGTFTILGVTIMILLGLDFGGVTFPWNSPKVICLIVFGFLLVGLFFFSEAKLAKYPLMPLGLFSRRSNVAALLVCFCHGITYISASYFMPLYFQAVGGASALRSGVLILPVAVMQSSTGILAGYFIRKTGRYLEPIWLGMTLVTLGFGLFIYLDSDFSLAQIVVFQVIAGIGVGLVFQSPLIALQSLIEPEQVATATATFGFVRNVGCAISVVLGGVVFQNGMQSQSEALRLALGSPIAEDFSGGSAGANVGLLSSLQPAQLQVVRDAYAKSLRGIWILYTCIAGVGLLVSLLITKQKLKKGSRSSTHTEIKDRVNDAEGGTQAMELR